MQLIAGVSYGTVVAFELAVTSALFGLIWIVQVVHYPLFGRVGREGFAAYESAHRGRKTILGKIAQLRGE